MGLQEKYNLVLEGLRFYADSNILKIIKYKDSKIRKIIDNGNVAKSIILQIDETYKSEKV